MIFLLLSYNNGIKMELDLKFEYDKREEEYIDFVFILRYNQLKYILIINLYKYKNVQFYVRLDIKV